jgi:putative endonuclease
MNSGENGKLGEKLAAGFLKKRGYKIIETNYRCKRGEIDIVARRKDTLVFVEVRARSSHEFGSPEESITRVKKERVIRAALSYREAHEKLPEDWQIDVVAIDLDGKGGASRIEHIENAVTGD